MAMLVVNGTNCPDPSEMTWALHDISASDAGRDANLRMWKGKKGDKREIGLKWSNVSPSEASTILKLFSDEYFNVKYTDAMENERQTRKFYRSDPTAPVRQWFDRPYGKLYTEVSFSIIEV